MRRWIFLLLPVWIFVVAFAELPASASIDEAAIVAEMENLIDRSGELSPKDAEQASRLMRKGIAAHDAHNYRRAIELYREVLAIHPLQDGAYYEMAYSYSALGEQTDALDAIVRALAINPKQEIYYVLKGNVLDNLGLTREALETYEKLLQVQPESYMGHLNLGITLHRARDFERADEALRRAMELEPEHPAVYFHRAMLSNTRGFNYDERRFLEKFLEIAGNDPRRAEARERLDALNNFELVVDDDLPYVEIGVAESMERLLWKTTRHRETFPEARGYTLTVEEDRSVYDGVLSMWRTEKQKDPEASYGPYDLLQRIDDAGFLDEYIWYHRQRVLGERATAWLAENSERVEAFLSWARSEGLLLSNEVQQTEPQETPLRLADQRELPAELLQRVSDSSVTYTIGNDDSRNHGLIAAERRRYAKFRTGGGDRVSCKDPQRKAIEGRSARALLPTFRCLFPEDPGYADLTALASRLGLRPDEIEFAPSGDIETKDDGGVDVFFVDGPAWLSYVLAKAAWRMEPDLRSSMGGPKSGKQPSVEEELYALSAAAGAYLNWQEQDGDQDEGEDSGEPFRQSPTLDRLVEAIEAGNLRGFVLFEVLHQTYGVSLERMSAKDAAAVEGYLFGHLFQRIRAE